MPQGLHEWVSDIDAWATYLNQTVKAINDGFVLDQSGADGTGVLTTRATFDSTTTFTVAGDATAFYVAGRRLRIVHAGGTTYCSVTSSAFAAGVTTVTIGAITQGPATMTTPITSMAVSPVFSGNAGNSANVVLTTAEANLAANVTFVTANTWYNGPSLTLAGNGVKKWLLLAQVSMAQSSGNSLHGRIHDGTNPIVDGNATPTTVGYPSTITLVAVVTPAASTTYTIQGTSDGTSGFMQASQANPTSGTNLLTKLLAVQIG